MLHQHLIKIFLVILCRESRYFENNWGLWIFCLRTFYNFFQVLLCNAKCIEYRNFQKPSKVYIFGLNQQKAIILSCECHKISGKDLAVTFSYHKVFVQEISHICKSHNTDLSYVCRPQPSIKKIYFFLLFEYRPMTHWNFINRPYLGLEAILW